MSDSEKRRDKIMNLTGLYYLKVNCSLLIVTGILCSSSVNATEWWDGTEPQSSFSEFAPPAPFSGESYSKKNKKWRSGSSFNETQKTRYVPVAASRNPWKPVNSLHYKKSFSNQRPWGNVPDRKPGKTNNMKFHDQRFKQWTHRMDSAYHNNFSRSNPFQEFRYGAFPSVGGYGYPGSIYNSPLITPAIYPGQYLSPFGYRNYPYTRLLHRPWGR